MSFKARCEFCQLELQAPDHALGMSVRCPRCENHFTVAPLEPAVALPAHWRGKKVAASSKVAHVPVGLAAEPTSARTASADPVPQVASASVAPEGSSAEQTSWRRHLTPAGVVALLSGGLGLMFASFWGWTWLTIPLAGLGIVIGLAGVVWAHVSDSSGKPVAVGGAVLSAGVLGVAVLFPGLLGPAYQSPPSRSQSSSAVEAIPLQLTDEQVPAFDEAGYADASRAALQQAGLRMHVLSVSVGPLPSVAKKPAPEQYLLIRLRVQRVQDGKEFVQGETAFHNAVDVPQLTLTDRAGKRYRQRALESVVPKENDPRPPPFPVAVMDEVFAFEPVPPRGVDLRLEVPTAGWGGAGVFRFTLPEAMIRREPSGPGSVGGSAGRP